MEGAMPRQPFRAMPLHAIRKPHRRLRISPILVMLPLAAFTTVFLPGVAPAVSFESPQALSTDLEAARFELCRGPVRIDCVVDGDTFWYRGEKIRLADINAPEVGAPACPREAELGARATGRLLLLLNQGPFTLVRDPGHDRDSYGRLLRTATRDGASLGEALVRDGLAEDWRGYRGSWC
jgi:endonuclease YncB( thermonuclease family)